MEVRDYMSSPAVTVTPEAGVQETLKLMKKRKFRRLPVVNAVGWLVGIVTERDLLYASPSPATSLSIWEVNYLLAKLTVGEIMTKKVKVAHPNSTVDEVARLLLKHKIGGLPVLDEQNEVIGVITESDIFRAFLDRNQQCNELDVSKVLA